MTHDLYRRPAPGQHPPHRVDAYKSTVGRAPRQPAVVLPQTLTLLHDYEHIVLGLILMGFMIFLRRGIVPTLAAGFTGRAT